MRTYMYLSWQPLADLLGNDTAARMAHQLGVSVRTVQRYQRSCRVPFQVCDELAWAVGEHPGNVWGVAYWDAVEAARCEWGSCCEPKRRGRWCDRHGRRMAVRRVAA